MKNCLRFLRYLYPHWPAAALAALLSLVSVAAQGAAIWIAAGFLQQFLSGSEPATPPAQEWGLLRPLDELARAVLQQSTPLGTLVAAAAALIGARLLVGLLQV